MAVVDQSASQLYNTVNRINISSLVIVSFYSSWEIKIFFSEQNCTVTAVYTVQISSFSRVCHADGCLAHVVV